MQFSAGRERFNERSEFGVGANGLLALVVIIAAISVATTLFRLLDGRFVGSTLVSQALVMGLGLALISPMIAGRRTFRARWGERAFAVAFRWFALPGLICVLVGVIHFGWIEGSRRLPNGLALPFVCYLAASGIVLWVRSVLVFGLDNLSMMYVYFPQEGRLVNASIYGVVRHPVYSAVLRIVFALVLWNGSIFALFAGCMGLLTLRLWVHFVEEPELLERFAPGYADYRAQVPAFFNLNPSTWPKVWRFLVTGV